MPAHPIETLAVLVLANAIMCFVVGMETGLPSFLASDRACE